MNQPDLFNAGGSGFTGPTGAENIPAQCRSAARIKATGHGGKLRLVESEFEKREEGCTADLVAKIHDLVLNTARRCVFDLAKEKVLLPIGVGMSRHLNPQTVYVHRKHAWRHAKAIMEYQEAKAAQVPPQQVQAAGGQLGDTQ